MPKATLASTQSRDYSRSIGVPTGPSSIEFLPGDRVDILSLHEKEWKVIAMDAVVQKNLVATANFYWLTVRKKDFASVDAEVCNQQSVKLQRTISLDPWNPQSIDQTTKKK